MRSARKPSPSISQLAGDGATQIGAVAGDVVFNLESAAASEAALNLAEYRRHQLSQVGAWQTRYTRLDAEPAASVPGQGFAPVASVRLALTDAVALHRRLIVLGGAGAGKTTSLLYVIGTVLAGGERGGSLSGFVPVFIELGRFRVDGLASPLNALLALIAEALFLGRACSVPPSLEAVRRLLRSHRFLVLLDGLNEAQAALRSSCLKAIDDLASLYTEHRFVLSSRPHGFSPPPDWSLVSLRELEDAQVTEFLQRATEGETDHVLLRTVQAASSPVFRLPLFLSLLVRLGGSPLDGAQRKAPTRSGLIAHYAESLLRRDLSKGGSSPADVLSLDRLREALERLAQAFQLAGQVLPLSDARKAIASGGASASEERADETLHTLCERGLLATDGQNVKFWHQTIQEYFYAGGLVRRWRGPKRQVGRLSWPLRRLVAKPEAEESLRFVAAHLGDEEAGAALRRALPINPALAISWADDLSLEGRAAPTLKVFQPRLRRFVLAALRYSHLGNRKQDRGSTLFQLAVAGFLVSFVLAAALEPFVQRLAGPGFAAVLLSYSALLLFLLLGLAPFLDALLRCPSEDKLEAALGAVPEVRDRFLRQSLLALAREVSDSRLARRDLRLLARGASALDVVTVDELIASLSSGDGAFLTTRLIGYLDTPWAVPVLEELLSLNNALSLAALDALATRANRLREDRQRIKDLLWATWNDESKDCKIRRSARRLLRRAGERTGGLWFLFRYFLLRLLKAASMAAAGVLIGVLLFAAFGALVLDEADVTDGLVGTFWLLYLVGAAALVWWDARRIGVRPIEGSDWNASPRVLALGSIMTVGTLIPIYILNRQRLRRDAAPVDWAALAVRVKAAAR